MIHGIAGQTDVVETVVDKESDTGEGQADTKHVLGKHVINCMLVGRTHYQMVPGHS